MRTSIVLLKNDSRSIRVHKRLDVLPDDFIAIPDSSQVATNDHQLRAMTCSETSPYHYTSAAVWNLLHDAVGCITLTLSTVDSLTTISL